MLETEFFRTPGQTIPKFPAWLPMATTPNNGVGYSSDLQTRRQQLACPSAKVSVYNYCWREMVAFVDLTGGGNNSNAKADAEDPLEGPYGIKQTPPPPPWTVYTLGSRLELFPNPGGQFAVWEACAGDDKVNRGHVGLNADGTASLQDMTYDGPRLTYVGHGGQYAFRHTRGPNPGLSLVQSQGSCVFDFYDGHVDALTPNDQILGNSRYYYKPN